MDITGLPNKRVDTAPPNKTTAKTNSKVEPNADSIKTGDGVRITSTSQEIKAQLSTDSSATEINEERVAAVRTALQSGSYRIDSEQIARKMLAFEEQLPTVPNSDDRENLSDNRKNTE